MAKLFYTPKQASDLAKNAVSSVINAMKKGGIVDRLNTESLDRAKADVQKWRDALDQWEDSRHPDRYEMMQLYAEIVQDDSVATHLNTIIRKIEGTDFEVGTLTAEGIDIDEDLTAKMKGSWFETLIRYIIEAEMYGFTLVEVTKPEGSEYTSDNVQLIPRQMVIPERGKVRTRPQSFIETIDFTAPLYADRLLQIGDKTEKGLFNNIALLYIYKKNAMAYWANYQSKFGIPPMIVKTDLTDKSRVEGLTNFMKQMGSNTFGLIGHDDEMSPLPNVNSDVFNTYLNLIKHADAQIAKVLEGQTMTSNDGSSRSQAEVHERTAEDWHLARLRKIERLINTQLLRIVGEDTGINTEKVIFRFKEIKNIDAIIDRAVKLKQAGYTVDAEYMSELTGLPLQQVQAAPVADPANSILKSIDDLYNSIDGHSCNC